MATETKLVRLRIVPADCAVYDTVVIQCSFNSSRDAGGTLMDSWTCALSAVGVARQICVRFNVMVKFIDQRHELAVTSRLKSMRGVAGETAVSGLLAAGLAPAMALNTSRSLQI